MRGYAFMYLIPVSTDRFDILNILYFTSAIFPAIIH